MKYCILSILLMLFLPLGGVQAEEQIAQSPQDSCVYKYLSCRDNCDYHQNESEVQPCKANCNRQYSCRPKKVSLPAKDKQQPFGEFEPG